MRKTIVKVIKTAARNTGLKGKDLKAATKNLKLGIRPPEISGFSSVATCKMAPLLTDVVKRTEG